MAKFLKKPVVEGADKLRKQLRDLLTRAHKKYEGSVVVGYEAFYAIFVHENLTAVHVNGQAKYLEQPMRELRKQIADIIRKAIKSGLDIRQAMLRGGLFLQRESQKLVPVDTGLLRSSAYTRIE